jgi:hypothetical protein
MLEVLLVAAAVVGIPALLLGLVRLVFPDSAPKGMPDWWSGWFRGGSPGMERAWHVAIAVGLVVLLFAALPSHGPRSESIVVAILALAILAWFFHVWRREFLFLMDRHDDDFPGRSDKLIWAIMLTMLAPVGLWFFRSYHLAHWPEPEPEPETTRGHAAADLS